MKNKVNFVSGHAGMDEKQIICQYQYSSRGEPYPIVLNFVRSADDLNVSGKTILEENARLRKELQDLREKVAAKLKMDIRYLKFPQRWRDEGILPPNDVCRERTGDIAERIWNQNKELPDVWPSVEEGIMLRYWCEQYKRSLEIEIYNDGDVVGIITEDRKIIVCRDIMCPEDETSLVEMFKLDVIPFDCPEL